MNYKSAIVILLKDRYAHSYAGASMLKFYVAYQKPNCRYYYVICKIDKYMGQIASGREHFVTKQKLHDTFIDSDKYLHKAFPISYTYKENMVDFVSPFTSNYPALRFRNTCENRSIIHDFSDEQTNSLNEDGVNAFDIINIITNTFNENDLKPVLSDIFQKICDKTHTTA